MAVTEQTRTQLIGLSVAMLGQAPGAKQLQEWIDALNDGMSLGDLAEHIADSEAFKSQYGLSTNEEFAADFLAAVMDGNASEAALGAAEPVVVGALNDGSSQAGIALLLVNVLMDLAGDEDSVLFADYGKAAKAFHNKVMVAEHYTLNAKMAEPSSSVLDNVTDAADSVTAAINLIDNPPAPPEEPETGATFVLTPLRDDIDGTSQDDHIIAEPVSSTANIFRETLNPFDDIDGGEGTDTIAIYGVSALEGLQLGAEHIRNVENVVLNTVSDVDADLRLWEGLESVSLERFGRQSDVRVVVDDGATVSSEISFGGKVDIVGASGELDIAAGGASVVTIGSAGETGSVAVKGGASVEINMDGVAGSEEQSESVTSVSVEGTQRAVAMDTTEVATYTIKTDVDEYVVGANGTTRVILTLTDANNDGAPSSDTVYERIRVKEGKIVDNEGNDIMDDAGSALKFNDLGRIVQVTPGADEDDSPVGITNNISAGLDPATFKQTGGDTPTVKVYSNSIGDIHLTNTDAVVLVKNDSKDEEGKKGTPEDIAIRVDGYGGLPGDKDGKICLTGAGTSENIAIAVAGDSDFRLATDKVKTLGISGDGDLDLVVSEFDLDDEGDVVPSESLESITLAGAGDVTLGLAGMSGLTMIDASASSGANRLTMLPSADALTKIEKVYGGSGNDTVSLTTATNGNLESIVTGEGNDSVSVNGMHSRDGIEVKLGDGDDTYSGTAGNTMSRIDAGDGEDTLKLTSIANSTYEDDDDEEQSIYQGFETLDVGGSETGTYDIDLLGIVNDVHVSRSLEPMNAVVTLTNMADGMGINVSGVRGFWTGASHRASKQTKAEVVHELAERESGDPRSSGELEVSLNAMGYRNFKTHRDAAPTGNTDPGLYEPGQPSMGEAVLTLTTGEDIEVIKVGSNANPSTHPSVAGSAATRMVASDYVNKITLDTSVTGGGVLEELIVDGNARLSVDTVNAAAFESLELVDATDNKGGIKFNGSDLNSLTSTPELELLGSSGKDVLTMTSAGGSIYGGLGGDELTGGTGDDTFIIEDASESRASVLGNGRLSTHGVDIITDFSPFDSGSQAGDTIDLSRGLLRAISGDIKDTTSGAGHEWDDWMTDSDGENPVTSIDGDSVDRANNDFAAANLGAFIGNGNDLFESKRTLASNDPRFSEVGDNTVIDKYSIAVVAQSATNGLMQGLWLLFDVDGNGDFDADEDMVIFLAGTLGADAIDGDMFT